MDQHSYERSDHESRYDDNYHEATSARLLNLSSHFIQAHNIVDARIFRDYVRKATEQPPTPPPRIHTSMLGMRGTKPPCARRAQNAVPRWWGTSAALGLLICGPPQRLPPRRGGSEGRWPRDTVACEYTPRRGSVVSDDELDADHPSSVEILYDESKAAVNVIEQVLIRYRTNTTAVLALGTGAATFFGFSNSPKGLFFLLSLVSYAVGVLVAGAIYLPKRWWWRNVLFRVVTDNLSDSLSESPPTTPKLRRDLASGYKQAITAGLKLRMAQGRKFRILLFATMCVVLFAGYDSYLASQHPTTTPPTHIVMDPTHT